MKTFKCRPLVPAQDITYAKYMARPEFQYFEMKNDYSTNGTRRRTRPWDKCWFSNKPSLINVTVEEACKLEPSYMKWIYRNLHIKWSVYTIEILKKL